MTIKLFIHEKNISQINARAEIQAFRIELLFENEILQSIHELAFEGHLFIRAIWTFLVFVTAPGAGEALAGALEVGGVVLQAAVSPAPATSGHWSSSEPSWQSFSMSHTQPRLMHWPLSQQNCFSWSHIGGGKGDPGR